MPFYTLTAVAAVFLQLKLLLDFGSVLTGSYVLDASADNPVPYWGFLAGLYEIVFLLFVLFVLSGDRRSKRRVIVIGLYFVTTVLRVAGGTRLILIKELAFLVILLYLRGALKRRQLAIVVLAIIGAGTAIGLLRKGGSIEGAFLGPFDGLIMESGLDALTFNIAYHVQNTGFIAENGDLLQTAKFVVLSVAPRFMRFWITQPELETLSPYNAAVQFGFDTPSPVGSMSGFATICYLVSYPILATIVLAITIGLVFRYAPASNLKRVAILVFCINTMHFWRDPIDIALKLVVQGVACALFLWSLDNVQASKRSAAPRRLEEAHLPPKAPTL
jgi:hypothetical protein